MYYFPPQTFKKLGGGKNKKDNDMSFITDNQTLTDLGIFSRKTEQSVYMVYNSCRTAGGVAILENMFKNPLNDSEQLEKRIRNIKFFQTNKMDYPLRSENFETAEIYLKNADIRSQLTIDDNSLRRRLTSLIAADNDFIQIHNGILAVIKVVNNVSDFLYELDEIKHSDSIKALFDEIPAEILIAAKKLKRTTRLPYEECVYLDNLIRFIFRKQMVQLLQSMYYIDVYYSVAEISIKRNFVFANIVKNCDNFLHLKGVYHPNIINGIENDIKIDANNNMIFLTGTNMAGKSTIMKSISIALYTAHIGFPVAAESMQFSVRSGMFTTINLPDNINAGYSHFYTEVMRLKKIAVEVRQNSNLFILFDELFRGTNVKDAYDATISIIEEFSKIKRCTFIVSTHIIEAAEVLAKRCKNIQFIYMPTVMENGVPRYTYKVRQGVTADRHGMLIINNERIVEIIESAYK